MSSEAPLPANPDEAISAQPPGPGFPEPLSVLPAHRRGHPVLAWWVILSVVAAIVAAGTWLPSRQAPAAAQQKRQLRLEDLQVRHLIGGREALKQLGQSGQDLYAQASRTMNSGSVDQRLRFVVLAAEFKGPEEARKKLAELRSEKPEALTPEQQRICRLLHFLFTNYARGDFPELPQEDRDFLGEELGYSGDLVLHPADGPDSEGRAALLSRAQRTFGLIIGAVAALLLAGLAGLAALATLVGLALRGKLRSGIAEPSGTGGLYAETFAMWIVLYIALSIGAGLLPVGRFRIVLLGGAMLAGLLGALAWPIIWGVSWRQVRQELGLTLGARPLLEVVLGFVTYISAIPMLAVGLLLTWLLMQLQAHFIGGNGPMPSHPIVESLERPTILDFLQILFVASVVAPIVEETMFRGVLYRHLREASARSRTIRRLPLPYCPKWMVGPRLNDSSWATFVSIVWSATVVSFIFAVIHPQGFVAVPALMALAFAFSLAREWRGSLVPAMVAHGLNNGIVLAFATFLFNS